MDELKKINAKIGRKQIGRIVGGIGSVVFGMVLIGKFMYQKGITDNQIFTCKEYPDEYAAITAKVIQQFEES